MDLYKTFEIIRKSNLEARQRNNYDKLLENAQALSDYIPLLIDILVEQENLYRKYEADALQVENPATGKLNTSSYAETHAKASEFYKEYRRAELTLDWAYECIKISKKLASSVGNEYDSQIK